MTRLAGFLPAITGSILFWLIVSSGLAFLWPTETIGHNPFIAPSWLLWTLIVITMFCLGTLVQRDELQPLKQHPWWVVLGVATQVLVMPVAAWLVTQIVAMPKDIAAGVILVGCVPGAMASNVLTHAARGSVAFSVSLTTVATVLSPLTVPIVLAIVAGGQSEQPLVWISVRLTLLVVLPTVAGHFASRHSDTFQLFAGRISAPIASIALLWIIASVVAKTRDQLVSVSGILIIALLLINLAGYLAGYGVGSISGLPKRFRRALSLEVGMQNAGLGTAIAVSMYGKDTLATIPTAAYTFGCMLTGTVLAAIWRQSSD